MARPAPMLLLALLAGCGGLGAVPRREPDPALELVERLPAGLARCVAARVARVPAAQRRAFREVSLAWPLAFEPGAPIAAAAVAAEGTGRAAPFVALFRTTAPPAIARAFFESSAGARLAFDEGLLCEDGLCRPVAIDFPEPTLLRIRQGTIVEARARGTHRCAALLLAHPRAVEVAAWTADPSAPGSRISSALASEWTLYARNAGLRVARVERYADPRFAATAAQLQTVLPPEPDWIVAAEPSTRVAVDSEVRFAADLAFRDLALHAQDQERLRRAIAAEVAFAWRLLPLGSIDLRRYEVVDRQVYVRRERLHEVSGAAAIPLARELVALIDRALEVHPEQERMAEVRFEVLLDVLGDPSAAAEAAEAALEAHPDDRSVWLARRREALLRFDLEAAAAALEEARVAGAGRGREAARAIRALLDGNGSAVGLPIAMRYPTAEAALAAVDRLADDPSEPPRVGEPFLIDWQAVPETAVALFELRGLVERSDRLLVVVGSAAGPGSPEPPPPFVPLMRAQGRERRFAVVSTDARGVLRAFGRTLPRAIGEATATLSFAVVSEAGPPRGSTAAVVLSGRATPRGFRVEAARGPIANWPKAVRLVAEPLARMHPFHRPAPAFVVDSAGREERRALLDRLADFPEIACQEAASGLACRSSLAGSALRRAWVRAAGPLLDP